MGMLDCTTVAISSSSRSSSLTASLSVTGTPPARASGPGRGFTRAAWPFADSSIFGSVSDSGDSNAAGCPGRRAGLDGPTPSACICKMGALVIAL
jgi:hypothetical protein